MSNFQVITAEQGTMDWFLARKGCFTGSEIHKLMGKKGLGQTGETYILQKAAEELTGLVEESPDTKQIQYGKMYEDVARRLYSKATGLIILQTGFIKPENINYIGVSPDGLIEGQKKGIEIKCPFTYASHLQNLLIKTPEQLKDKKPEYYWQIMLSLMVTEFESWDYVSFSDWFSNPYKLYALEILPNEDDFALLKSRISEAIEIKQKILAELC